MLGIARLPDGTNASSLVVRGSMGLLIGSVLIFVVRRMLGALADPPPATPARVDARETEVVYECPTCGTRVRLELAATAKAPRHCGEEMEPSLKAR
jgi:DNA-directed RNA polymerase subunit RPC12/RpoP